MDLKHYWEHHVPILLVRPQLVSVRPDGGSSIEFLRAPTKPLTPWRRLSRNLRYQWAMSLGRLRSPLDVDRIPVLREMREMLSVPE
jgi:glycosyl transferase family 25